MWCVFTPTNINHHSTRKKQQDKNPEESGIQFPTLAGKLEMELGVINLSSPLTPSALRIQVKKPHYFTLLLLLVSYLLMFL